VNPKKYPWRIVVIAAISIIGYAYLGYYMLFGLAADGVDPQDQNGRVIVTYVDKQTAGGRAGFQVGDQDAQMLFQKTFAIAAALPATLPSPAENSPP
jgi:ammonia channel protein AmtB